MTDQPIDRPGLPIACTLQPDEGRHRLADWKALSSRHGAGRDVEPGRLRLHFRGGPEVGALLTRLVAAESDCCGFLTWDLARDANAWTVMISGDDDALGALPLSP